MTKLDVIVNMKFGSHLYGTATENSDLDFKGVFLPTKEQILLNKIQKSHNIQTKKDCSAKNTSSDVDTEFYSLHYFIRLACEGQTVALDMLHAPKEMIIENSSIWKDIVKNREKFYTKNLHAFIGYARRQAAKYGIKGSRLSAAKRVMDILFYHNQNDKMSFVWDKLPEDEHLYFIENNPNGIRQYQVCGRILQETQKIGYAYKIISKFHDEYGKRARLAAENKNVDWKAVSHAIRAAYQVKELLTDGTITFPLPQAEFILAVKSGKLDYQSEVSSHLELLMDEVEALSKNSKLPEKPDREFWDQFTIRVLEDYVL